MSGCKPWVNLGNFLRLLPPTMRSAFTPLVSVYLFCGCAEICCLVTTAWVPMIQTVTPCWTEILSITTLVSTGLLCGFLPAGYSLCISLCLLQTTLKSLPTVPWKSALWLGPAPPLMVTGTSFLAANVVSHYLYIQLRVRVPTHLTSLQFWFWEGEK